MCSTCLRNTARCAEPSICGLRRCGKRNAYTTISACGEREGRCSAHRGRPAPRQLLRRPHSALPTRRLTTSRAPQLSPDQHACGAGGESRWRGRPTCTAPMAITHMQNRKMPRGTSGKVTIKENCSQKRERGLQARQPRGPGASPSRATPRHALADWAPGTPGPNSPGRSESVGDKSVGPHTAVSLGWLRAGGGMEGTPPPPSWEPQEPLTRQIRLPPGTPSLPSCAAQAHPAVSVPEGGPSWAVSPLARRGSQGPQ